MTVLVAERCLDQFREPRHQVRQLDVRDVVAIAREHHAVVRLHHELRVGVAPPLIGLGLVAGRDMRCGRETGVSLRERELLRGAFHGADDLPRTLDGAGGEGFHEILRLRSRHACSCETVPSVSAGGAGRARPSASGEALPLLSAPRGGRSLSDAPAPVVG